MDWTELDKTQEESWDTYPQEFCKPHLKPSYSQLFEKVQSVKDDKDWVQSIHPFCKSCYSAYKKICKSTGVFFGLGPNWNKEDLEKSVLHYILDQQSKSDTDKLNAYEHAFIPLIHCLGVRWYQHSTCFTTSNALTNLNVQVANPSHVIFLRYIVKAIGQLYLLYKPVVVSINNLINIKNKVNHSKLPPVPDMLHTHYKNILNICRTIMIEYGSVRERKEAEEIFETSSTRIHRKPTSNQRRQQLKQQSRTRSSYKISGSFIETIIDHHFKNKDKKQKHKTRHKKRGTLSVV